VEEEEVYIPETPHIKLNKINQKGLVKFTFTKTMLVPGNLTGFDDEVLLISIKPGFESKNENLGFTWELVSYTEEGLDVQINFEKAVYVSSNADKDILNAMLMDPNWFVDYENV